MAVDTVVQEVSSRFRDFRKRQPAAAGGGLNNNSSPSSTTPATRPELSPPLPAALRGRGSGGGGNGSSGGSGDDAGQPSLADAEGGEAGGFSIASPPLSASSADRHPARTAAAAAAVDDSGTSSSNGGGAGAGAGAGGGIGRPEDAVFPRELGRLPRQLFHLRRGPLLGPLLQNSDDPLCLRHLFLRGALEECLRMMEPSLVSLKVRAELSWHRC